MTKHKTFSAASFKTKNIPKRMTPFLHPAVVCWMRPIKAKYFLRWNRWLVNAPKSYTAAGNVRSPGYAMVLQWISEIWDELDSNLIARSFDNCGITSSKLSDFNNQLRHFVRTTEFADKVQPDDSAQSDDLFEENGDDWEEQTHVIIDSESEDENERDFFLNFC